MSSLRHRMFAAGFAATSALRVDRWLRPIAQGCGVILTFHHVRPWRERASTPNRLLEITPEFLDRVLTILDEMGFELASLDEVPARLAVPTGNSITVDIVRALRTGLESAAQNPHLKLITVAGEGADFSFGASIPEHTADRIGAVLPEMHALLEDLLDAPSVTAAIVRGRCLGGGFELALACDFIFAAEDAAFGLPEIALGVFPPAGSLLLPARVGSARAGRTIVRTYRAAGTSQFLFDFPITPEGVDAAGRVATEIIPRLRQELG